MPCEGPTLDRTKYKNKGASPHWQYLFALPIAQYSRFSTVSPNFPSFTTNFYRFPPISRTSAGIPSIFFRFCRFSSDFPWLSLIFHPFPPILSDLPLLVPICTDFPRFSLNFPDFPDFPLRREFFFSSQPSSTRGCKIQRFFDFHGGKILGFSGFHRGENLGVKKSCGCKKNTRPPKAAKKLAFFFWCKIKRKQNFEKEGRSKMLDTPLPPHNPLFTSLPKILGENARSISLNL